MPRHRLEDFFVPPILALLCVLYGWSRSRKFKGALTIEPTVKSLFVFLFVMVLMVGYSLMFYHELFASFSQHRFATSIALASWMAWLGWSTVKMWKAATLKESEADRHGAVADATTGILQADNNWKLAAAMWGALNIGAFIYLIWSARIEWFQQNALPGKGR